MGVKNRLRNWAEKSNAKIWKENDEKINRAWIKHGEPYLGLESVPVKDTSGKYLIFREKMKDNRIRFTISDHKNPEKPLAETKVDMATDNVAVHSAWTKPFYRGYSTKKFLAYGVMAEALGEAVKSHVEDSLGCTVSHESLTDFIFDRMVVNEIEERRKDFVAKRFISARKSLDRRLKRGLSEEEYHNALVDAERSANQEFLNKVGKESEKMMKKNGKSQ